MRSRMVESWIEQCKTPGLKMFFESFRWVFSGWSYISLISCFCNAGISHSRSIISSPRTLSQIIPNRRYSVFHRHIFWIVWSALLVNLRDILISPSSSFRFKFPACIHLRSELPEHTPRHICLGSSLCPSPLLYIVGLLFLSLSTFWIQSRW